MIRKRIEQLVQHYAFPAGLHDGVTMLARSKNYGVERCFEQLLSAEITFSSDVLIQTTRSLTDEMVICASVYAQVGQSYRQVVLFEAVESVCGMTKSDIVNLLCAVIEEIEVELEGLRRDGVLIATCEDLRDAWTNHDLT